MASIARDDPPTLPGDDPFSRARGIKKGPDRSSTNKYLSFNERIVKIGPTDPEITGLRAIIKNRKKLTQSKHIALTASLRSGLKDL